MLSFASRSTKKLVALSSATLSTCCSRGQVEGRVLTVAELERKPLDIESSPPQNSPRSTQKDLDRAQDVARMLRA